MTDDAFVYPREPAGHPFIGMEKDYGFAPANVAPVRSISVEIDEDRWTIQERCPLGDDDMWVRLKRTRRVA